jgi:hypothetical protein
MVCLDFQGLAEYEFVAALVVTVTSMCGGALRFVFRVAWCGIQPATIRLCWFSPALA